MNPVTLLITILLLFGLIGVSLFMAFTRQGKNLYVQLFHRKKYVICHLKHLATDYMDVYRIVPEKDYLTPVSKGIYDLNPNYKLFEWKGRLHFLLEENDVVPKYIQRKDTTEEILIQVNEVRTALNSCAYDELFGKKKEIAIFIACVGLLISILVGVYTVYELQKLNDLLLLVINRK
ncbi:MAG: hypothetical protein PHE73_09055 [Sulfurovaceae bacterium]|nr:hypothetical protein [Sulfurovaceae bacterium]